MSTGTSSTGVLYDASFLRHDTGAMHPEGTLRYEVLSAALDAALAGGLPLERLGFGKAGIAEVLLCHEAWYHDVAKMDADGFAEVLRTGDTAICHDSYDVALEAVGAAIAAADAVHGGRVRNAFAAVRPPGHHASPGRGMGFCIFNNVAIAARHLQQKHGLKRIAILDWDVHHGNGTQDIFYRDGSVFFASSHEENLFPHTGAADERGEDGGEGTTLNIPVPEGAGGDVVVPLWRDVIGPALEEFSPEFILVSTGYDARAGDPLGMLNLTDGDFAELARMVCGWAGKHCAGRAVFVLEGGYDPDGLASAVRATLEAMASC